MEELPAYEVIGDLCAAAAREFRQIIGFNRILIYRFDAEWNGEVLAEDGKVSVTDLVYPPASATGVAAYAVGGTAKAVDIKVTPIRP